MHILFICNEYPPAPQGGIGTFVYYLSHWLTGAGHRVTVVGLSGDNGRRDDEGVTVYTLKAARQRYSLADRRQLLRWLEEYVKAAKVDVVEVPEFDGMLPFAFKASPVVVRLHMPFSAVLVSHRRPPDALVYYCELRTVRTHRNWIGVSEYVISVNKRLFWTTPNRCEVIYNFAPPAPPINAVEVDTLRQNHGDYVLFVGKPLLCKGAMSLANAAKQFLRDNPKLKLIYLGRDVRTREGFMYDRIRNVVGKDLSSRVLTHSGVPHNDVMKWMAGARACVFPSYLEAFSMVAVEAAQSGTAVVFTKRASGPELFINGEHALLVDPGKVSEIANAVTAILHHPEDAQTLTKKADKMVRERFTIEACATRSLKFYESLCS